MYHLVVINFQRYTFINIILDIIVLGKHLIHNAKVDYFFFLIFVPKSHTFRVDISSYLCLRPIKYSALKFKS